MCGQDSEQDLQKEAMKESEKHIFFQNFKTLWVRDTGSETYIHSTRPCQAERLCRGSFEGLGP